MDSEYCDTTLSRQHKLHMVEVARLERIIDQSFLNIEKYQDAMSKLRKMFPKQYKELVDSLKRTEKKEMNRDVKYS